MAADKQGKYKVTRGEEKTVLHSCLKCGSGLENRLEEAGDRDKCPVCAEEFVVPGAAELAAENERKTAERIQKRHEEVERQRMEQEVRRVRGEQVQPGPSRTIQTKPERSDPILVRVPGYGPLLVVAISIILLGAFSIATAISVVIYVFFMSDEKNRPMSTDLALAWTAVLIAEGIVTIAIGTLLEAVRDIARNSFMSVNLLNVVARRKDA